MTLACPTRLPVRSLRYAEMVGVDREATTAALQQLVELIVAEMLQPKLNGLEMRN